MKTYFISGLGGDKRLFSKLILPQEIECAYLEYIPNKPGESLADYSKRMAESIDAKEDFQLVGLSFGGLIASEIAKVYNPKQVTIISSIATGDEVPWYLKMAAPLLQNPFFPLSKQQVSNPVGFWLMGAGSNQEQKELNELLNYENEGFLRWALHAIATWDNTKRANNLFHIHGSADKLFPVAFVHPDFVVEGGEHLMVLDKQKLISDLLSKRLMQFEPTN